MILIISIPVVTWPGVMEYIQEMRNILYDLETRIQKAKLNVENIEQLMQVSNA